ncbi:YqiA/YcfP family alpha/beta fold hydrolase [Poseidonibacter antarcticus]|uniref:YqiA/YcfP family alpha/beta fold hydrolase n=1 Tax=Poseidonibacter antarcticus TaxID=2478538 RepID=UPI000EF52F30|nr:YqiA/YcfP family alpha/beta fold hydrolase [Poseidonibacter antarcticus]
MIIYLHGFASAGFGVKAQKFLEYFEDEIITPTLPTIPNLAIATLEQLIEAFLNRGEKVSLIGSSLGGFYSLYLANKYNLKAVLINPAVYPWITLENYRKDEYELATSYYDNSKFEFNHSHSQSLRNYEVLIIKNPENFLTLLQDEDEILDYEEAAEKLEETNLIIEEGGNHSFVGIEKYFRKINSFLS